MIYRTHDFEIPYLKEAAGAQHKLIFTSKPLNEKTVNLAKDCYAVSLFSSDDGSKNMIKLLDKMGIRFIALRMAGFDHVDLQACEAAGIKVANVARYSPHAIAERAMTLALITKFLLMI